MWLILDTNVKNLLSSFEKNRDVSFGEKLSSFGPLILVIFFKYLHNMLGKFVDFPTQKDIEIASSIDCRWRIIHSFNRSLSPEQDV